MEHIMTVCTTQSMMKNLSYLDFVLAAKVFQGEVPGHKHLCEAAFANGN